MIEHSYKKNHMMMIIAKPYIWYLSLLGKQTD